MSKHIVELTEDDTAALAGWLAEGAASGPVYYHGHGREERALTGIDAWDNAGTFVSHDPEIAKLYGPKVDRIEMASDARVHKTGLSNLNKMIDSVQQARDAGADVLEFHPPKDFVGHIILNPAKIASREPWEPQSHKAAHRPALHLGRVTFEPAERGGILVRTSAEAAGRREPQVIEREADVVDALRGGPLTAAGIAAVIFRDTEVRPVGRGATARVTQSLIVLERDGVVRRIPVLAGSRQWELT